MIAEDHQPAAVANEPGTLARIRPVADDVAEAGDRIDLLLVDVGKDRLEGLEVAVDVADNRPLHANSTPAVPPSGAAPQESDGSNRSDAPSAARERAAITVGKARQLAPQNR
jgi:hypothetical protein